MEFNEKKFASQVKPHVLKCREGDWGHAQRRKIVIAAVFALVTVCFPLVTNADGMMLEPDPYADRWDYADESSQQAVIKYENGRQTMALGVEYSPGAGSGAVWLFPVPSEPKDVEIDVLESQPQLMGQEITLAAQSELGSVRDSALYTQLYIVPFLMFNVGQTGAVSESKNTLASDSAQPTVDVTVFEHLDKKGVTVEVLAAKTADGLNAYLAAKGLDVKAGSISALERYIGADYSFVVSWLSKAGGGTSYQRGVVVSFPTDKLYFPLVPTSVYGNRTIPATVRVLGHVTPDVFSGIEKYTTTEYYTLGYDSGPLSRGAEDFINVNDGEDIRYTKITIEAPSEAFTDDLWIVRKTPFWVSVPRFIVEHSFGTSVILVALASVVSSIFAGMLCLQPMRKRIGALALIGLSNFFTLYGVLVAVLLLRTKPANPAMDPLIKQMKERGYYIKRRIAMVLLAVSSPWIVLFLPFLFDDETYFVYLIVLALFLVGLFLRRVDKADQPLLKQLQAGGYSPWRCMPYDPSKKWFFILFSIFFILIVNGLTELMRSLLSR
ncbi:MAG: DUF2330 domain-containing protein [Patescibacteria group bacterium]|nr:DUF2330 domain-containing protein [Patescibacteria group bacterium]MDD5716048.1 DUF2330 domain-containing protein [Patescibacteria group bacterium]